MLAEADGHRLSGGQRVQVEGQPVADAHPVGVDAPAAHHPRRPLQRQRVHRARHLRESLRCHGQLMDIFLVTSEYPSVSSQLRVSERPNRKIKFTFSGRCPVTPIMSEPVQRPSVRSMRTWKHEPATRGSLEKSTPCEEETEEVQINFRSGVRLGFFSLSRLLRVSFEYLSGTFRVSFGYLSSIFRVSSEYLLNNFHVSRVSF